LHQGGKVTVESSIGTENSRLTTEPVKVTPEATLALVTEAATKRPKIWLGSSLRQPLTIMLLVIMDAFALLTGLALAGYVLEGESRVGEIMRLAPILVAVWFIIFVAWDLYVRMQSQRTPAMVLGAILTGSGFLVIGSIMYPQAGFSAQEIMLGTLFVALLGGGLRLLWERKIGLISQRRLGRIPALIIGEAGERARVRQAIEQNAGAYTCVGELNTRVGAVDLPLLRQAVDRTGARSVILAGSERLSYVQFPDLLRSMRLRKVNVKLVPGANTLMSSRPMVFREDIGVPLFEVGSPRLDSTQWALKRTLDVAGALGALLILSPLLIAVAALIKLTSPGPVFFRQKRVGSDEKVFTCYKFRSMYEDAERRQAELEAQNQAGSVIFKIKNDPRITPVGRFIRRWSIDELPQLINVLRGDMSLVGPRPLPIRDCEHMQEIHKQRLATVPGITGYWQISGRSNLSFEEMLRLDLHYIENWSLSLDIGILLKTVLVVLRHDGAY
jgi:exopolysaccharide biosynthesis polyprenyl glycosylphosphotransferase